MTYRYDTPIRYVRGTGPVKARELTKIGITTVGELLERHPLSYIYPGEVPIADAKEGMVMIRARILQMDNSFGDSVEAILRDETGSCYARWYTKHVLQSIHPGMIVTFYGKMKGGVLQQPKWFTCEASMTNVYGGQYGVHHTTIRAALKEVLSDLELPEITDGRMSWDRAATYFYYHFPVDKEEQQRALSQLKFDEALTLQLALTERRRRREQYTVQPMGWNGVGIIDDAITSYFPYKFTIDQNEALTSVIQDLNGCVPMQRLIHGEVGSGKTTVAFYAAMLAALNGKRTLILCPTSILAQQHFDVLWDNMNWGDVGLYVAGKNYKDKQESNHIIIGTHALLHNEALIKSASLVIIDEFQKFGVEQRAKIQKHNPHLLLMSATPIPRSLAAIVFGDLDVSVIRELPIKRGTVITKQVLSDRREIMWDIVRRELAAGHQAYVVYPRISGDEDVVSAERGFEELCKRFSRGTGIDNYIEMLIGKDTAEVKAHVLRCFRNGQTKILVSTIIAEVGLDNPNATVMVIEGADRFGLSQLHQLRGRVCRSTDTAFCFLVSETSNPTSIARLEVIEKTNDGFLIAEEDLRLRGPGEVFSTRQSGLPDLEWISLVDDYDLMLEAKELVAVGSVGSGVREMMTLRYGNNLQLGKVI